MSKKRKTKEILLEFSSGLNCPSWYDPTRCGTLLFSSDLIDYKSNPKEIAKPKIVQKEPNLYDHLIE